jgi:uncharacterized protein (DUF952 family)
VKLILHITPRLDWQQAQSLGYYEADSLLSEGFIHCSDPHQAVDSANRFFWGQANLVLLCINTAALQAELRYDPIQTGDLFPHLYGPLNLDAVVQVLDFPPKENGEFELPEAIEKNFGLGRGGQ